MVLESSPMPQFMSHNVSMGSFCVYHDSTLIGCT